MWGETRSKLWGILMIPVPRFSAREEIKIKSQRDYVKKKKKKKEEIVYFILKQKPKTLHPWSQERPRNIDEPSSRTLCPEVIRISHFYA